MERNNISESFLDKIYCGKYPYISQNKLTILNCTNFKQKSSRIAKKPTNKLTNLGRKTKVGFKFLQISEEW